MGGDSRQAGLRQNVKKEDLVRQDEDVVDGKHVKQAAMRCG